MPQPEQRRNLLHIISGLNWERAKELGELRDPSLEREGFIHCSFADQVLIPANERFIGQTDLLLLIIDPADLTSRLVVEDSYGSGNEFPHVYGPIEIEAIVQTVPFPCNKSGAFSLPEGV